MKKADSAVDTQELSGQVALITGAGRGIGLATASELARRGAGLILVDIAFGNEALALVENGRRGGQTAVAERVDLADSEAAKVAMRGIVDRRRRIDVLVNNAGWLKVTPFLEISTAEWERHLAINLSGMFLVTQAVLPGMLSRGSGRIVNISSELALTGAENYVAYCASKGGVVGFTRALAREVAPNGIRVNSIAPGPTVTRMLTDMTEEFTEHNRLSIPARRFGTPEDIALSVAFLAGPGGEHYIGQILSPNGGVVV